MADKSNLTIYLLGMLIVCSICSIGLAYNKPVLVNVQVDVEQGSDKEYVYNILNEIEKRGWSVTVYFTGEFAMEYPDIVKDIHDKRHQIAVCGWTVGEDLTLLSYQEQADFINESFTAVRRAINNFHNAYIADFKPQGFKQNEDTFKALQKLNIRSNAGFLASETKTHPYHTDYGFIAIPIATVKVGSEDVPLIDDAVFDSGASALNYHDYLKKRYDESLVTKEPFTIIVHSSVTGSDKAKLEAFTRFLDHVKETNGQIVMTDYMTIMANPYMTSLIIYGPDTAKAGSNIRLNVSYYAHCDCPNYYIKLYGKYANEQDWKLRNRYSFSGAPVGRHSYNTFIKLPISLESNQYIVRAVGMACHGDCWPSVDYNFETEYEKQITTYCNVNWEEISSMAYNALRLIKNAPLCWKLCGPICAAGVKSKTLYGYAFCAGCLGVNKSCHEGVKAAWEIIKYICAKIKECLSSDSLSEMQSAVYRTPSFSMGELEFTDVYSEGVEDTDNDGFYDYLTIRAEVNNTTPGHYQIISALNKDNLSVFAGNESYLGTGSQSIVLRFEGTYIYESKVNGPFNLSYLFIFDEEYNLIDYCSDAYTTLEYQYSMFQPVGKIEGFITDPNGQPVKDAYLQASEIGDIILSDNFDDNILSPLWSKLPNIPEFSIAETNEEIKIDGIGPGWNQLRYKSSLNQDVEASIRVRTPIVREGTSFSFFIWNGGPGSNLGEPEWGHYRISRYSDGYTVLGQFHGQDYRDCGTISFLGDEVENFHTYKIVYEKSKERMGFFIDDSCICTIEDVNFVDFEFSFKAESWETRPDIDIRVDDFLVKEFIGFTPEIKGTAFTDPNGAYAINRLRPATYEIDVLPPEGANLLRDSAVTVLDAGETEMVNFILDEGGIVSGHVRDTNGVAVYGAYVEVSGPGYATSTTDANGIYKLTGLASRTYNISVIPSPYANLTEAAKTVQAVKGETRIVDFTLQPAGSIAGRITDANGTPITNVYVFLSGHEMPRYSVGEDGRYIISGLPAGTYTINTDTAETEFFDESKTVHVILGQTTTADFVLRKGRAFVKISGYVMNTSSSPLSDVPVWIKNTQNDMEWIETTNEDGYFEFTNVPAGLYEININDEEPKLSEYTEIDFDAENTVNVNEDLVLHFTLWRVGVNAAIEPITYINGDTIDVNVTVTNNDIQDLVDWSASVELEYENYIEEVLDSNVVPINIAVGETKSFTVAIKIPEDNIYSNLNLDVEIRKNNFFASSNIGPLPAIMYQGVYLDGIIQIREQAEHYQEDFETGDFSTFNWILSGDADWFTTQQEKNSGSYSAQSGEIDNDENSSISVTLDCISGNITFYLKVSSEDWFDFLQFYIDGERKAQWSGQVDWTQVSFPVTEGTRTLKWAYEKDFMISENSDTSWIDDIVFPLWGSPQGVLEDATSGIKKLGSKKSKVKRE